MGSSEALRRKPRVKEEKGQYSMPLYEHVFLVRQDASAPQVETLTQQFKSVIESNGGTVPKVESWGIRSLSYRIKKNRKAHFTLMNIEAPPEAVAEMERQLRLSTDVIRFLTVKVNEHETGPSPMMRRADRDERDGRGERGDRRGGRRDRDRDFAPRETRPAGEVEVDEVTAAEEDSE